MSAVLKRWYFEHDKKHKTFTAYEGGILKYRWSTDSRPFLQFDEGEKVQAIYELCVKLFNERDVKTALLNRGHDESVVRDMCNWILKGDYIQ